MFSRMTSQVELLDAPVLVEDRAVPELRLADLDDFAVPDDNTGFAQRFPDVLILHMIVLD